MKSTYEDVKNLGKEWDFWFSFTQNLPKKNDDLKNNSYCFILNNKSKSIDYVSESMNYFLGYTNSEFDIDKIFAIIHPDDLDYVKSCEYQCIQINNKFYFNEHFQYSFHYSYRIKKKNGVYITIKQRYETIEVDDRGHLYKTIVLHELMDDYLIRPKDDFKIFDRNKGTFIYISNEFKLTRREIEILDLVNQGFTSFEISDKLHLSKHTIDTHRKNIVYKLKKTKT